MIYETNNNTQENHIDLSQLANHANGIFILFDFWVKSTSAKDKRKDLKKRRSQVKTTQMW